ncbi:MAG: phosphoesterase [Candidatus Latescibacteria bacterium]|nr:phosphoesterase [bacterium]MBD3425116.1 phosphoesterase [Candidatus Latescibacterota bacterium]
MNAEKLNNELDSIFRGQSSCLIALHSFPDPDAMASGMGLKFFLEKRYGLDVSIAYGGLIGRAENRTMVKVLDIPLKKMERIKLSAYDRIAMVDAQPTQKNLALDSEMYCHLIIDHHPVKQEGRTEGVWIDTSVGATAVMIYELLQTIGEKISTHLATALVYAIRSETQDLGRKAGKRDIEAYLQLFPRANMKYISRIVHPVLPRNYFQNLIQALKHTYTYRHIMVSHLEDVPYPEMVAEFADFLLRLQRHTWVLCTGRYRDDLILSMRTTHKNGDAGELIKSLVPDERMAGGHEQFAGGAVPLGREENREMKEITWEISRRFASGLDVEKADWKPLVKG